MVTCCYQRMTDFTKALKLYREIHEENPKLLSVRNSLFAGVVKIMFYCLSSDILQTWKNCALNIRFKVFDYTMQAYDSDNGASLISSDEEEEEGSESEEEDYKKLELKERAVLKF